MFPKSALQRLKLSSSERNPSEQNRNNYGKQYLISKFGHCPGCGMMQIIFINTKLLRNLYRESLLLFSNRNADNGRIRGRIQGGVKGVLSPSIENLHYRHSISDARF